MAQGNLAVPRLVPSPQWEERDSLPHTHPIITALQPEQSYCYWSPHCWAGCPHGEGHRPAPHFGTRERTAPFTILLHGAYEYPGAEGWAPNSVVTYSWW